MKKFVNWLLNHMVIAVAIVTFTVTLAVIGGVMLHSHLSYKAYVRLSYRQTRSNTCPLHQQKTKNPILSAATL